MNASDAQEHLEMVERIVAASSRKLEAGGEFFVLWGLISGTLDLLSQLASDGRVPPSAMWLGPVLVVAGIVGSTLFARRCRQDGRMSFLQREFITVLWLTLAMALAVNLIGGNIFAQWAQAAVWSVAASIVLFYIGAHGNRRAQVGGIMMLASIAFANFNLPVAGYALAAGMYLGYAGFGVTDMLARD